MTSSGICFSAEHKQRCRGCYSSLRYPPFVFLKINYNILIVLRFPSWQNSAKSTIMSKSTAGLLLSASQQTGTIPNSRWGFSLDACVFLFFFQPGCGKPLKLSALFIKRECYFHKEKKRQQWRVSVVYQPSLSNYYRCINHIDASCSHYFSSLLI